MTEFTEAEKAEAEVIRMQHLVSINTNAADREVLEERHGKVWDTDELGEEFEVLQFAAPYVVVRRKSDEVLGTTQFQHDLSRRFYFNFQPDNSS